MKYQNTRWFGFIALLILLLPESVFAQVRLPSLVSDGMVLQRNANVPIWGWADAGQDISISFNDSIYQTDTNNEGNWTLTLSGLKAGGPYRMIINTDTLKNIWVGDVWVSSGQSNMELPLYRVRPLYEQEIAMADNEAIRYFDVPQGYNFQQPKEKLGAGYWEPTTSENVLNFSAAAYFFARDLYEKYQVPIGVINASVGGSPAESWISEDALKRKFPEYYKEAQRFKDSTLIEKIQQNDTQRRNDWYTLLNKKDQAYQSDKPWYKPEIQTGDWSTMEVPGYWNTTELGDTNGVAWFRKSIDVLAEMTGKTAELTLGRIVDTDSVFVNGTFVGNTTYKYPPRRYMIPEGVLKEGENTIAIRVINERGEGGFFKDKAYELSVDNETIDLKGSWEYRLGAAMEPLKSQTFIHWKPVGLYNAMIAPLQNYRIKGVIWYQGESNTGNPEEYQELFSLLINNWRTKWNQGDFPFLFAQLANFMEAKDQPGESNWAALREAQRKTLSVANTAMAVAIDIGEWNDVHPLNKKEVGHRLALGAQKIAYNEDVVYSGPKFESIKVDEQKAILTFSHTGSGLTAKGDSLEGFAIAGSDHNYVWANAKIDGDKVILWSDEIKKPTNVRYGWADNPVNANLYNKEGLPASPFEAEK